MTEKPKDVVHKHGKNGFNHRPRFGLLIETESEALQEAVFNQLKELGFKPRVVTV